MAGWRADLVKQLHQTIEFDPGLRDLSVGHLHIIKDAIEEYVTHSLPYLLDARDKYVFGKTEWDARNETTTVA